MQMEGRGSAGTKEMLEFGGAIGRVAVGVV